MKRKPEYDNLLIPGLIALMIIVIVIAFGELAFMVEQYVQHIPVIR